MRLVLGILVLFAVACSSTTTSGATRSEDATSIGAASREMAQDASGTDSGADGGDDDDPSSTSDPADEPGTEPPVQPPTDADDGADAEADAESEPADATGAELTIDNIGWPLPDGAAAPIADTTPLEIDPNLRSGQLDNGLVWYARSNDAPGLSVSMRLVVDAGSLHQDEPASGLAHFVEHMMFNGTERYPANTLETELSALGATIGPDLNAFTSSDETVYQLDLQSNDLETLYIGLDVLSEWAGKALFDDAEVAAEIGVVREEIRLRDEVVGAPIDEVFDRAYTQGTQYENAGPGGLIAQINEITTEDALRYYDRWYRPDNMAVVVVGDYPIDTLVQAIEETHSGLVARGPAPDWEREGVGLIEEPFVEVVELPEGGQSFISIDWALPTWDRSTVGGERLTFVESLLGQVMENRLSDRIDNADYDLFDPSVGRFDWNRERSFIGLNVDSVDLALGTQQILSEFVHASETGVTDAELDRALALFRSAIESQSDAQVFDYNLADVFAFDFLAGSDTSPADVQMRRQLALLDDISGEEVTDYLSWMLSATAPLVIIVSDDPVETPTRQELLAAVSGAIEAGQNITPLDVSESAPLQRLMEPPEPVAAVTTNEPGGTDRQTTIATYANGAQLIVVESQVSRDQVFLDATSSGGWSTLAAGDGAIFPTVIDAIDRSGLGEHESPAVTRYLETRQAGLTPWITDANEGFVGSAASVDAETMFELLHLNVTAPRVDPASLEQARRGALEELRRAEVDPGTALFLEAARARFSDNPWYEPLPTEEQINSLDAGSALRLFQQRFSAVDDLQVYVYGDISTDDMLRLGETWIATLPARDVADQAVDVGTEPPAGVVTREVRVGTEDGSGAILMTFAVPGEVTDQDRVTIDFLRRVIDARLFQTLREELSATYGGSVFVELVEEPTPYVESEILVNGDPARVLEIRDAILAELTDLAENGPAPDEFERTFSVIDTDYGFIDNQFLLDQAEAKVNGEDAIDTLYRYRLLDTVTADDLQAMTARMFPVEQRIDVIRLPGA